MQAALQAAGVPTAVHYPVPLQAQPAYARFAAQAMPVTEALAASVMSLPMSADLPTEAQDRVVDALRAAGAVSPWPADRASSLGNARA